MDTPAEGIPVARWASAITSLPLLPENGVWDGDEFIFFGPVVRTIEGEGGTQQTVYVRSYKPSKQKTTIEIPGTNIDADQGISRYEIHPHTLRGFDDKFYDEAHGNRTSNIYHGDTSNRLQLESPRVIALVKKIGSVVMHIQLSMQRILGNAPPHGKIRYETGGETYTLKATVGYVDKETSRCIALIQDPISKACRVILCPFSALTPPLVIDSGADTICT